MQEFSSVTASSYDADSLAPLLTEKSAEGWSVISIVAAGTNIIAYLERESDGSDDATTQDIDEAVDVAAEEPAAAGDDTATDVPATAVVGGIAAEEGTDTGTVDEPAGWAVAPESETTDDVATDTPDDSIADLVAGVEAAETAESAPTLAEAAPVEEPAVEEPAVEEPAAAAAAPESTVPAGWYADPSGRFELRYWDGNAWTEHVSRAGQQFTDPPVA